MATSPAARKLWNHPLKEVSRVRKSTPEAWLGECLADEVHDLTIMVRSLEYVMGFAEGRAVGRVENVLAIKLDDQGSGEAAVAANSGANH